MGMGATYRTADATVSAINGIDVVPSDASEIPITRGLYIGTGGTVRISFTHGGTVTFVNVANGTILPVQAKQVWDTGTTASDIIAFY